MADRIKGITVVLGGDTKGLSKALSGVNKDINSTQKQLKDVERLLKLDPTNTELLAQKQRLLADAVALTKGKLDSLKEAEKQVQQQFERGEVSQAQYDALQREIVDTEIQLKKAKTSAQQLSNKLNDVSAKNIEEVGDEAKKASKQVDNLADAAEDAKDNLDFSDIFSAGILVEGIGQVVDSLEDLQESTKENRRIMASLELSSDKAGYTADQTAESYEHLYGVLGDDQTSATTLSNLQALRLSQKDLNKLIDGAIGAWATYGDSIPIDGLSEAVNETIRTGKVTGTFADVLNWAGTSEDDFNEKLADTQDESERAQIVLKELTDQGLVDLGKAWQDTNKDIVDANKTQLDFVKNSDQLSQVVTPIVTGVKDIFNDLAEKVFKALEEVDWEKFAQDIETVTTDIKDFIDTLVAYRVDEIKSAIELWNQIVPMLQPVFDYLDQRVENEVSLWQSLKKQIDVFISAAQSIWTQIAPHVQPLIDFYDQLVESQLNWLSTASASISSFFQDLSKAGWDALQQVSEWYTDVVTWNFLAADQIVSAFNSVRNKFTDICNTIVDMVTSAANTIIEKINGMIGSINGMIDGINGISVDVPDWVPGIGGGTLGFNISRIGTIPYLAKGGTVLSGMAIVGEAGPELLTVGPDGTRVQPLTDSSTHTTTSVGGITVQVFGAAGQDINALADAVMDRIETAVQKETAVFGGA